VAALPREAGCATNFEERKEIELKIIGYPVAGLAVGLPARLARAGAVKLFATYAVAAGAPAKCGNGKQIRVGSGTDHRVARRVQKQAEASGNDKATGDGAPGDLHFQ
jgi:hypothetical protein